MREIIGKERLCTVPSRPGVYLMTGTDPHTREPRVLYVGKSINLRRRLASYLNGSSPELLAWLRERLAPAMTQSAFAQAWLTADLETLENFFTRVTRRNAELRRRFGVAGTVLRKAELDDLLALAQATRALRKQSGQVSV